MASYGLQCGMPLAGEPRTKDELKAWLLRHDVSLPSTDRDRAYYMRRYTEEQQKQSVSRPAAGGSGGDSSGSAMDDAAHPPGDDAHPPVSRKSRCRAYMKKSRASHP